MAIKNKIDWLKDRFGNVIVPKTLTKAIYDDAGNQLSETLNGIKNNINAINDTLINTASDEDITMHEIVSHINGYSPCILDGANAPIVSNKIEGYLLHKYYNGHNLLELTAKYAFVNNVEFNIVDKSIIVLRGGASTSTFDTLIASCTLEPGEYICSGVTDGSSATAYLMFGNIVNVYDEEKTIKITTTTQIDIKIHVEKNAIFSDFTIRPMIRLASSKVSNYEPYVGGVSSPNLERPQRIYGLGDMGYFNGKLIQGHWDNSNGQYNTTDYYTSNMCSKNMIECNANDIITVNYGERTKNIDLVFYNENKEFITANRTEQTNANTQSAPSGSKYFMFNIGSDTNIDPYAANHVAVTINGMYIIQCKTTGKNILDFNSYDFIFHHDVSYLIEDDVVIFNALTTNDPYIGEAIKEGEIIDRSREVIDVRGTDTVTITITNPEFTKNYYTEFDEHRKSLGYKTFESGQPISLSKNACYINVRIGMQVGEVKEYRTCIQVEKGDKSTPYEKYHETVANIPVSSPLFNNDYIKINSDGSGKLVRNWGSVIYDGINRKFSNKIQLENNILYCDNNVPNCTHTPIGSTVEELYCNRLINKLYNDLHGSSIVGISYGLSSDGELYFGFGLDSDLTTLELVNNWLITHNLQVVYKLATPIEEDLTAKQISAFKKLYTFEGVTNIICDGKVNVFYFKNTETGNALGGLIKMIQNTLYTN